MNVLKIFVCCWLLLIASGAAAQSHTTAQPFSAELVEHVKRNVAHLSILVVSDNPQNAVDWRNCGTAYFVGCEDRDLLAVTALHCVTDFIVTRYWQSRPGVDVLLGLHCYPFGRTNYLWIADIDSFDARRDLALLRIPSAVVPDHLRSLTTLTISSPGTTSQANDDVLAVGFPHGTLTVFQSKQVQITGLREGLIITTGWLLESSPDRPRGISGAPIVSPAGHVIGTWWGIQESDNRGIIISLKPMHDFMRSQAFTYTYPVNE